MTETQPPDYDAPERGEQIGNFPDDIDYATEKGAAETNEVFADPDWDPSEPIPVYIAGREDTPEITKWEAYRYPVDGTRPVHVSGARRNRTKITVENEGTNTVFVAPTEAQVSGGDILKGARIASGGSREMTHNGHVWAMCATGESCTVSVIEEYSVSLDE